MTYALIAAVLVLAASTIYFWRKPMDLSTLLDKATTDLAAAKAKVAALTQASSDKDAQIADLQSQLAAAQANAADPAVEEQISNVLDQIADAVK